MIQLSEMQQRDLACGKAVDVHDDQTFRHYVVLSKEVFDRVRRMLFDDSECADDELRMQLARSARENGWDEPGMERYDHYDEELGKRCK